MKNSLNKYCKYLDPLINALEIDEIDNFQIIQEPLQKLDIRPAYCITLILLAALFLILVGFLDGFISTLLGVLYPAYKSYRCLESTDQAEDEQWLMYCIIFSVVSALDSSFGFPLSFIPLYHLVRLGFYALLLHPKIRGVELFYSSIIYPSYVIDRDRDRKEHQFVRSRTLQNDKLK